ncbi:SPOR domain-containing protein [Virgibacillus necropolis]|uniref:SPOR domain-containing protein n=1 Tax=Virgibacillus necropolis TaxID=163877 RepID=UPI00386E43E0
MAGSFKEKKNADDRVSYLDSKGIPAFVDPTNISGETWYRVQAGAFEDRKNAEERLARVREAGIENAFIIVDRDQDQNQDEPIVSGYPISGPVLVSPEQLNRYVRAINPNAPVLGSYYLEFGEYYGIKGDIAFAQALHETDYFRFTGVVEAGQNNYAGIGATGPDNQGASFATPRDGVLAHIQHLFAYASTESLPDKHPLIDPRFDLVQRGSAPTWQALNGKWAVPGDNYGQSILRLYERIVETSISELETVIEEIQV